MLMSASHLRHLNESISGLSALDLLANIATPHIGQCLGSPGVRSRRHDHTQAEPNGSACGFDARPNTT
jgi:hypothetical protein